LDNSSWIYNLAILFTFYANLAKAYLAKAYLAIAYLEQSFYVTNNACQLC